MRLRGILTDKCAVNILKFLFDKEAKKKAYTVSASEIRQSFRDADNSIDILNEFGLINIDSLTNDKIMSISAKGKHFIDIFDKLVKLTTKNVEEKKEKSFKIRYELTQNEKRIMVVIFRLSKESGNKPVSLGDITREIYPADEYRKKPSVARYVTKLDELNLVEKSKKDNMVYVKVTPTGERTIKEQLIEALL